MTENLLHDRLQRLKAGNRREYGELYETLPFLAPGAAPQATARRSELLAALSRQAEFGCGGTKLDMRRLSPGCRICTEGNWSCLFINGRCNARCFYCPSRQDETGLPTTNAVTFRSPADYPAYLAEFGFRGMSLSGGEPLLTPGRSLAFLGAVKRYFGDRMHAWLYTNGTLVDRDILGRLRDAGLDEIRFDVGAVGYALDKAELAVGVIPTVTVEIPAVPEDLCLLKEKMLQMAEIGIDHLNLHQLRLTPYSLPRFAGRPYTFLHGEKVTVLESELAALALVRYGLESGVNLPVNYCSFVYKQRYQKAAARRRSAECMRKPYEAVTDAGFLRCLALTGAPQLLSLQEKRLREGGNDPELWSLSAGKQRLCFAPQLWPRLDFTGCELAVDYAECVIREPGSYRNPFREFRLPSGRKVAVERFAAQAARFAGDEMANFARRCLWQDCSGLPPTSGALAQIIDYEFLLDGLQEYF